MPSKAEQPTPFESRENTHRSVRVFAVAPIRAEQLEGLLAAGRYPDEISFVEVILAQKADTNLVTAIGGEMNPGENLLHAGMRKVFEKSLLTRESLRNLQDSVGHEAPLAYRVTGQRQRREAFLTVMPVRSGAISLHEPREDDGDVYKIQHLVNVTPGELRELFISGFVRTEHWGKLRIFGHLTQAPARDVSFSADGRQIQRSELARVMNEIRRYEQTLRDEMKEQINLVRRWHKKPEITGLGQCGHEELTRGFLAAQMILGFTDERMRDNEKGERPPTSTDLLTASLYFREFKPEQLPDALVSMPTAQVRRVRNILNYALRGTVQELYGKMKADITPFISARGIDTIAALRVIWPQVVALRLDEHTELLKNLDARFIDELAVRLRKPRDLVKRALEFPERIPRHIAGEMQKTKNSFQQHHPINEVASAIERPFVQMLHVLGLHPYKNVPSDVESDAAKRTRGEMLMIISAFFTAIPVIEQHMAADNSMFENGLARFLKYPPELDEIQLNDVTHVILRRETENPVGGTVLQLWYDKRPLKSEEREWFKKLQAPIVYDDFSHNFIIRDENFTEEERRNIPLRLDKVEEFRNALIAHFRKELGPDWRVYIVPQTHKHSVIDTVRELTTTQSFEERKKRVNETVYKRRPGSIANMIIREKFVLAFEKETQAYFTEICIYPFQSINVDKTVLSGSGLVAFTEKLLDDMEGRYAGRRLIQTDADDPTGPSPIELWEPAAWSRSRFDEIKLFQHTPKKKKR